jgi:hypothetical protein
MAHSNDIALRYIVHIRELLVLPLDICHRNIFPLRLSGHSILGSI